MTDLDTALRDMLRARATDIDALPAGLAHFERVAERAADQSDAPVHPRRTAWLVAAAVAAVLAVVGTAIAVRAGGGNRPTPATHRSRPTTHHTRAPSSLRPLRCTAPLPADWRHALAAGTVSVPGHRLVPLAVTDDGSVLADEAAAVAVPHTHELVLVAATGSVRTLYDTPPPASWNGMRIGTVSTAGDWAAFALLVQAQSGGQGPVQIELVNIKTGVERTLRATAPNDARIVLGPALERGSVYWTEIDADRGLSTGRVRRYDIATRTTSVVSSGAVSAPVVSGGAVYWTRNGALVGPGNPTLPAGFDLEGAIKQDAPLLSDGATHAWLDVTTMSSIKASTNGQAAVTVVPRDKGGRPTGLTGDLLWWPGDVLDLRSGAALGLGGETLARGNTAVVALGSGRLAVLDTADLSPPRC